MKAIKATYKMAHSAGWDAANKSKRDRGLREWDCECLVIACETLNKLWPIPKDQQP